MGTGWLRALPALALVGPGRWFVAALVRAAGFGRLDGGLDWIIGPEGVIMSLGGSFFAATYVMFGRDIAFRAPRSGITVIWSRVLRRCIGPRTRR